MEGGERAGSSREQAVYTKMMKNRNDLYHAYRVRCGTFAKMTVCGSVLHDEQEMEN